MESVHSALSRGLCAAIVLLTSDVGVGEEEEGRRTIPLSPTQFLDDLIKAAEKSSCNFAAFEALLLVTPGAGNVRSAHCLC